MPPWRCPHCSTPQPEASRCWVCHRSSTSCGTCRHFRGSVAARLGFCGLDRRRGPLQGDEVQACWEDGALPVTPDPVTPGLLDLLTLAALGEMRPPDPGEPSPGWIRPTAPPSNDPTRREPPRPGGPGSAGPSRPPIATASGSRRLWVEVEV